MKSSSVFKSSVPLVATLVLLPALYAISLYNYLLFHTLIELFSLLTVFGIFALAWHTRANHDNRFLLFLGIAFLFSGVLALLHLISYKGMGIFPRADANLATQFWVAFRIVFSLSFLISVRFIRAKLNMGRTIGMYLAAVTALTVSILLGWFPDCYTATGLTRFKIVSEYAICLIFLSAFVLLIRNRRAFDPDVLRFTILSILFSIATEISFTEYASVYGFLNMLGHLFLLASVASIYRAIVVTAVVEPSTLLFRDLKQREEAATASEKKYRLLFENMINALAYHRIVCDEQGRPVDYIFLEVNAAFEALTGLKAGDVIGRSVRAVLPDIEKDPADWIGVYGKVALTGHPVRMEQQARALGKWFAVSAYSPAPKHFVAVFEDITERKRAEEALRESERQFRTLADSIPNLAWWANSDGYITWYNRRWYDYTGTTPEQMKGWGWQTVHDPAVLPKVLEQWRASLATGEPFDMEFPLRGADGIFRPFLTRIMPVKDSSGAVARWFGTNTDVSDRVLAEKRLAYLASFPQLNPNPVLETDMAGEVAFANPAAADTLGRLGRDRSDALAFVPDDLDGIIASWDRRSPLTADREVRIAGRVFNVTVFLTTDLNTARLYAYDITERKRAEEALEQSMHRFELLSGTAGDLLLSMDPQTVVDSIYRKVMEQLKCDAFFNFLVDDAAGKLRLNSYAGIPPEEARRIEWLDFGVAVCGCVARDGRRIIAEHIATIPDERTEVVKAYGIKAYACHPILGPAGKVLGTLSFGTRSRETFSEEDLSLMKAVTDQVAVAMIRMRDEQALRELNAELEQRVAERTAELRNLQAHVEAVREAERTSIAREIHDELGQVLTAIKMDVSWLSKRLPREQNSLVDKAEEMLRIIDAAIQSVKRISAELRPGVLDDIGLSAAIEWACKEFGNRTGIRCAVAISPENLTIDRMRSTALFRILQEALTNIVRHAKATRVSVSLHQGDNAIILTVKDNGKGIQSEEVSSPHAFGLIGMRERVQFLHGRITFEGFLKRGTTVTVTLPIDSERARAMPDQTAREGARQEPGGATAAEGVMEL